MIHTGFKSKIKRPIPKLANGGSLGYDRVNTDNINTNFNWGDVGTGALSGAATGVTVGGPWGAAIGAVVGAGAGAYKASIGQNAALDELHSAEAANRFGKTNYDRNRMFNYEQSIGSQDTFYAAKGGRIPTKDLVDGIDYHVMPDGTSMKGATHRIGEGVQVQGKAGKDTIPTVIDGKRVKLDNKEIVVRDAQGNAVVISDDLGEADKYRTALKTGGNPEQIALQFAERAKQLNPNPQGSGRYLGGLGFNSELDDDRLFYGNPNTNISSTDLWNRWGSRTNSTIYDGDYKQRPIITQTAQLDGQTIPFKQLDTVNVTDKYTGLGERPTNSLVPTNAELIGNSIDNSKRTPLTIPRQSGYNAIDTTPYTNAPTLDFKDSVNSNLFNFTNNQLGKGLGFAATTVGNISAANRLAKTSFPTTNTANYLPQNIDANAPIFNTQIGDIRETGRQYGRQILDNTSNSNVAISRLGAIRANELDSIAKVRSNQIADRNRIGNINTQGFNRTNLANTEISNRGNRLAYEDKVSKINTDLGLVGSTVNSLNKIIGDKERYAYQNEYLQTIANKYNLDVSDPNFSIDSFSSADKAKLMQMLKESGLI